MSKVQISAEDIDLYLGLAKESGRTLWVFAPEGITFGEPKWYRAYHARAGENTGDIIVSVADTTGRSDQFRVDPERQIWISEK